MPEEDERVEDIQRADGEPAEGERFAGRIEAAAFYVCIGPGLRPRVIELPSLGGGPAITS